MALKPTTVQAALVEEAITAKLHGESLDSAEREMLETVKQDLAEYRQRS